MNRNLSGRGWWIGALCAAGLTLSGCGMLAGGEEPTPTAQPDTPRAVVPTFTPTPVTAQAAPPAEPTATATLQVLTVAPAPVAASAAVTNSETVTNSTAAVADVAATPAPQPRLEVEGLANVRLGPGTTYGLVGSANQGETFDVKGKSADGQWWLICCINGQEGWIFGDLVDPENGDLAPVVEAPAAPAAQQVAQAPAQPAAAPAAEPTATPAPAPAPAPADACAGIGGDGCKFRLRAGPSFAPNGGGELKFQLHFIHSGIEGGQPQGSYFVWVEKDGQKLPISDGTRSTALADNQAALGRYNYEYKVPLDQIPGNNVAGSYLIWVLDGNGERDSQTFSFNVPDGQGDVWMQFDQG